MIDLACSTLLLAIVLVATVAYGARVALHGRAASARVEREGDSLFVAKGTMEMFHWVLEPFGAACERLGVSANFVTWGSLALAAGAGVALALGHFGVGAALATLSAAGDALDGAIARRTRTASEAGEVLDAAVDRYGEFAFLAGLAFWFRAAPAPLVATLLAVLASFMVSYSTAKAEALQLEAPRGSMRRTERAIVLILGAGLSPLAAQLNAAWLEWPMVAAIGIVAVGGNISAIRRLAAIARAARERDAVRGVTAPEPITTSRARDEDDALHDDGVVVHQGRTP
jgi:CDP-diacylglycerol--glycerol-3-phosphate 3-phosphatidyltransferase